MTKGEGFNSICNIPCVIVRDFMRFMRKKKDEERLNKRPEDCMLV